MTSNAGSNLNTNSIGFGKQTLDKGKVEDSLKDVFRPEFLNRIDEIIVFNSLQKEELLQIVDLMLQDTIKALKQKDIAFEITDNAKQFILEKGTNIKFGARPLRRAIQRYIEDEISEKILRSELANGQTIKIDLKNNELIFEVF
jgi:ATP-dependent Clp protease ATP-binding subunit ClpA